MISFPKLRDLSD